MCAQNDAMHQETNDKFAPSMTVSTIMLVEKATK